jgi:hypothetical protein
MTRTLMISLFLVAACTRHNPAPGGVGGGGASDGGVASDGADMSDTGAGGGGGDDGGATSGGDLAPAPLPDLPSGNYSATSSGLLANNCTAPPENADLGIWMLKVVSPTVWNLTVDKNLSPAVLDRMGALFVGQTTDTGMPIYGCMMRETYELSLTPTSTAQAQGRLDTVFDQLSGDCSQYEPVLPCTQSYAVTLDRAN